MKTITPAAQKKYDQAEQSDRMADIYANLRTEAAGLYRVTKDTDKLAASIYADECERYTRLADEYRADADACRTIADEITFG